MQKTKSSILFGILITVATLSVGCGNTSLSSETDDTIASGSVLAQDDLEVEPNPNQDTITFGSVLMQDNMLFELDSSQDTITITTDELLKYESTFGAYNSFAHKDTLSTDSQVFYNAILYMYDNEYTAFAMNFDTLFTGSVIEDIFFKVALDDPSLSFNFSYGIHENTVRIDTGVSNYSEYNKLALDEANLILDELIPENATEIEKANLIYTYLTKTITYANKIDESDTTYLYSALVEKKTNCDGFSNAYSLLCNMAGVKCYEISYTTDDLKHYYATRNIEKEESELSGHIWNMVNLSSGYTFVDVSAASELYAINETVENIYFAYNGIKSVNVPTKFMLNNATVKLNSSKFLLLDDETGSDVFADLKQKLLEDHYIIFFLDASIDKNTFIGEHFVPNTDFTSYEFVRTQEINGVEENLIILYQNQ